MTAEVAIAMPAVALVLALCLGGVHAVGQQVRLQDAASVAARALGRGEAESSARALVAATVPGATLETDRSVELVCATASANVRLVGAPTPIEIGARACAPTAGR
ncbi:Flp pilus assembly protein TadG [Pseudoclavibacter chungangensis]|uniref:TadE family type IV pilus minor pilin n=1 Tax=Pseudoclavibacter chungangensis TaxID=587635 RepID=UPI0017D10ABB|nr:TadE family type IV pilus minor pilin [Pseudoclavibacter chungangensis]NYJ67764.1 Flp pilus assembly protein TadG [Pseudoclavibacter chungangensis]